MPCYTLVQVEIKDKAMAEKALKEIGEEADIEKNRNGTYTVTPTNQNYGFRNKFMEEYSAQVATKKAKQQGWTVTRKQEQGETVLIMRKY